MIAGSRQQELYQTLVAEGFKRDRKQINALRFVGTLEAAGREVAVAITFRDLEFTSLPEAQLLHPEQEAPDVTAHLDAAGGLCFASNGDVVLDRYDVGGSALLCIELAKRGLERALTHKRLAGEIAAEFPQHWDGIRFYYDFNSKGGHKASFHLLADGRRVLCGDPAIVKRLGAEQGNAKHNELAACVLDSRAELTFLQGQARPRTLGDFVRYVVSLGLCDEGKVFDLLASEYPNLVPMFLNAPNGCVGIQIPKLVFAAGALQRKAALSRLLRMHADKQPVERLSGSRIDPKFIFERNMHNQQPLTGKRIAIIGCGTIGSHLAKMLAQSGAGHGGGSLLLLDNQSLEPGNIGRHYLGMPDIGKWKVDAMREELRRQFPEANISAIHQEAVSYLPHLHAQDLLIDATGEEALSVAINAQFLNSHRQGKEVPSRLHVWLFGNGAAAQGILVDDGVHGCFRCLKAGNPPKWRFSPMKAEATTEWTAAACGEGRFIPYGVAAPTIAAALGFKIALDWCNGDPSPRLRTILIDENATRAVNDKNPSKNDECPACAVARN